MKFSDSDAGAHNALAALGI